MGKLRSNFVGTEFQVFDDGCSPNGQESGERTAGAIDLRQTVCRRRSDSNVYM